MIDYVTGSSVAEQFSIEQVESLADAETDRPGCQCLMNRVESGEIDAVVSNDMNPTRNVSDLMWTVDRLRECDLALYFIGKLPTSELIGFGMTLLGFTTPAWVAW